MPNIKDLEKEIEQLKSDKEELFGLLWVAKGEIEAKYKDGDIFGRQTIIAIHNMCRRLNLPVSDPPAYLNATEEEIYRHPEEDRHPEN